MVHGMVYGMVYGMVLYGVILCVVWCMIWMVSVWYGVIGGGTAWYGMVLYVCMVSIV